MPSEAPVEKVNEESQQLLQQLADAISSADIEKTKLLLAQDVQCVSDGGPKMSAARKMLVGQEHVFKFLKAIYGKYFPEGSTATFSIVNHLPALVFKLNGKIFRCMVFEMDGPVIRKIFIMVNPDKFQGLDSKPRT